MVEFIIYVKDQDASTSFYSSILKMKPVLHVPGMTEFELHDSVKLGIMPENGIAKIICPVMPNPSGNTGIPRCELYLHVDNPQHYFENALKFGAKSIQQEKEMDWGHCVAYIADPDGHIIAFAKVK